MKKILKIFLGTILFIFISILMINLFIYSYFSADSSNSTKTGLVFGARVYSNGNPSSILKDRLKASVDLYNKGKIKNIIVSGDNSIEKYDEPTAMKNYLVGEGIPKNNIFIDYAGFDTFDSVYRAKYIFGVKNIVLISQEYHLPRAVYISKRLGLNTDYKSSDLQVYRGMKRYKLREILSRVKAFLDVEILKSKSKFLGDKIDMNYPQSEISIYDKT